MKTYTVTCYSPPGALKVQQGNVLEVEGFMTGNKIRASSIRNVSLQDNPTCNCGQAPYKMIEAVAQKTKTKGTVSKIVVDSEYIQFELTEAI